MSFSTPEFEKNLPEKLGNVGALHFQLQAWGLAQKLCTARIDSFCVLLLLLALSNRNHGG